MWSNFILIGLIQIRFISDQIRNSGLNVCISFPPTWIHTHFTYNLSGYFAAGCYASWREVGGLSLSWYLSVYDGTLLSTISLRPQATSEIMAYLSIFLSIYLVSFFKFMCIFYASFYPSIPISFYQASLIYISKTLASFNFFTQILQPLSASWKCTLLMNVSGPPMIGLSVGWFDGGSVGWLVGRSVIIPYLRFQFYRVQN